MNGQNVKNNKGIIKLFGVLEVASDNKIDEIVSVGLDMEADGGSSLEWRTTSWRCYYLR